MGWALGKACGTRRSQASASRQGRCCGRKARGKKRAKNWMIQILSLQIDATVFILHRPTALRKIPPLIPEFDPLHHCFFGVSKSIPAQADGHEHYGWCQARMLLLLEICACSSSRRIPRHPKWPKLGKC